MAPRRPRQRKDEHRGRPSRARTPLPHVRGRETRSGDSDLAARLAEAFTVHSSDEDLPTRGVHGLHPYPARLHPAWARRLLASSLVPKEAVVLDPFCGSGTVLVEAMLSGRPSLGSDCNPLAVRIARLRTSRPDGRELEAFARAAARVHAVAARRRETPHGRLAAGERRHPPHVLAQLISLRAALDEVADARLREGLLLAFSPLVDKFAARPGRAAPEVGRRAVRDEFIGRCERMAMAWADFSEAVDPGLPDPGMGVADARHQPWEPGSAGVVISSPPYPGVYDYAALQEERARWLAGPGDATPEAGGSALEQAARAEIGRRGSSPGSWACGMRDALRETCRVLAPGGRLLLVVGDGVEGDRQVRVLDEIAAIADDSGGLLCLRAAVSQERPFFHRSGRGAFRGEPRREHLVLLDRG